MFSELSIQQLGESELHERQLSEPSDVNDERPRNHNDSEDEHSQKKPSLSHRASCSSVEAAAGELEQT